MTELKDKYINLKIGVPTDFEDVFSHFYFAENRSADIVTKTLLPSFQTILTLNFGNKALLRSKNNTDVSIDRCFVFGPIKQAFDYSLPPNSKVLVANFKDDAFYRFFGIAAVAEPLPKNPDDLSDEICFTILWEELNKIDDVNHQISYMLDFFKPYLRRKNKIAQKFANLTLDNLSLIKSVASQEKQTERNIQLQHKKYLGYSSKEINRYKRFLKAIELIQNTAGTTIKIDWFKIINECGYYDQSQFIRDFKYYLNISPTKYLKFHQDICMVKGI
ncbi:helix-turn-helix domain-containing protein [Pararhodonellum marinum]|uniref:helix-turn-helix domain-containing protein n=1 Tax=Pararhodonellum marinum TaxID=2755358 RepID=UPI00188EC1C0|nr:helix-turn-helix domain-containing protein [Pararhodonellum marinum]